VQRRWFYVRLFYLDRTGWLLGNGWRQCPPCREIGVDRSQPGPGPSCARVCSYIPRGWLDRDPRGVRRPGHGAFRFIRCSLPCARTSGFLSGLWRRGRLFVLVNHEATMETANSDGQSSKNGRCGKQVKAYLRQRLSPNIDGRSIIAPGSQYTPTISEHSIDRGLAAQIAAAFPDRSPAGDRQWHWAGGEPEHILSCLGFGSGANPRKSMRCSCPPVFGIAVAWR